MLNVQNIKRFLQYEAKDITIEIVKETKSTNDDMKQKAINGEKEFSVLIAERQTMGKGSKGRSFFSPEDTGIYMSILVNPTYSAEKCTLITSMTALAVAEAIEQATKLKADIKWINDIYINRKKAAGILTESVLKKDLSGLEYAVVGIGINVFEPRAGFPIELESIACALSKTYNEELKAKLVAFIINRFMYYYKKLEQNEFIEKYRDRLFFLGEDVTVIDSNGSYKVRALTVDEMCRLVVMTNEGIEKKLYAGEISIKPKA